MEVDHQIDIEIEGMTCGHCKQRVKDILESVDGVINAEVDLEKGTAVVQTEDRVSRQHLIEVINNTEVYQAR